MNVKDGAFKELLIKKLDELSEKIDALIQVVAITSQKETILKGKTKTGQIKFLSDLGLPRTVVAWIVGTTPDTVSVRLSEIKSKKKKTRKPKEVEESHE